MTHGTICKGQSKARVNISHPETISVGQLATLYLKVEWLVAEKGKELELAFKRRSENSGGDVILFDGENGPANRKFEGNVDQFVAIYAKAPKVGNQTNTYLEIKLNGDVYKSPEPIEIVAKAKESGRGPDEKKRLLQQEMIMALANERPANGKPQRIWDRYNAIFEDCRAIGAALENVELKPAKVPAVDGTLKEQAFDLNQIRTHLASLRSPEGESNKKAIRRNDVFDPFQGHWKGEWRQETECKIEGSKCQDHDWLDTLKSEDQDNIFLQHVIMGPDSRAYITDAGKDTTAKCIALDKKRDLDTAAINAINIETGTIIGAVGVRKEEDAAGIISQRPTVGFYVSHGILLWVSEELREGAVSKYSIFYEISQGMDTAPVQDQRYTIIGFEVEWDRDKNSITNLPLTTYKAGQYRKILTAEQQMLEQHFRDNELKSDHLEKGIYRRRLEMLSPERVQEFLNKAPEGDIIDYLENLLLFVSQQKALRDAPNGERESITFIMGEDRNQNNQFYTAASHYFQLNPTTHFEDSLRSLTRVRDFLENNAPDNGRPWGEINIVVHANEDGGMTIPVLHGHDPDFGQANPQNLQLAIDNGDFVALSDGVVDVKTKIRIRGCSIGRSKPMLELLGKAFGGDELNRPQVYAPVHIQVYEFQGRANQPPETAEEYYFEFWVLGHPTGQVPNRATLVREFQDEFPEVANLDWDAALRNNGNPTVNRPAFERRQRTFKIRDNQPFFGIYDPANEQPPRTLQERLDIMRGADALVDILARIDLTIDDYTWGDFQFQDRAVGGGNRRWQFAPTGRRTVTRVQRELREPDPDNPGQTRRLQPEISDAAHFGFVIPAPEAEQPIGENVPVN